MHMAIRDLLPEVWRGETRLNPIRHINRLQRNMDRVFNEFFNEPMSRFFEPSEAIMAPWAGEEFVPACDVEETDSHYLLAFDLPGVKKEDVKIELRDNQLSISGERREDVKGRLSRERSYGLFTRSFTLPSNVNSEKLEANYENGVLQVVIPKTAVSHTRQISIKEGKLIESKSAKAA